ncbi:MAG: TonB-dependent receptor [Bryobacteraceae bacterium]
MTAGIAPEYGRRLGGVIALDTRRISRPGHTSEVGFQAGSYGTYLGSLAHQYRADRTAVSLGVHAGHTDRYLDPPSLANFTNKASVGGFNGRLEHDLSDRGRLTIYLRSNRTRFLVPNDLVQQAVGQRQDRSSAETAGQVHYQHNFFAGALGSVRGMVRDLTAKLWSNTLSTRLCGSKPRISRRRRHR